MGINWGIVNRDEIHRFNLALNQFRQGFLSEDDFTAQRLQFGIYGQRQDNQYMVRIKIPGGLLECDQLHCIGQLIEKYSSAEFASITTRQDIQLHFIKLQDVPKVLLRLSDVGLVTREACGNTVRNITACALAGVCPKEQTDIRPLLNKTTQHFLRHPLTQHLPRKFKMSFSGCETDCAMGLIHDLAVIAVESKGKKGFKILVGGGLGHKPREAIVLEEFVEEKQVIPVIESVITLHNRYSDRKKRAKSRIKFLVDRFGEKVFLEKYHEIYASTGIRLQKSIEENTTNTNRYMQWCKLDFKPGATAKRKLENTLSLDLKLGDIRPRQIRKITDAMNGLGLTKLRTTQSQNLLIVDLSKEEKQAVSQRLGNININEPLARASAVACPGSWTCRLGITASRELANLVNQQVKMLSVNISGCHNSCAQPQVSDIGLHGEGRRKHGKLIPFYRMYLGGDGSMNGGFALKGPEIPANRVLLAIKTVEESYITDVSMALSFRHWVNAKGKEFFMDLLKSFAVVSEQDVPSLIQDLGARNDFKVLPLGGGECAGVSEETVSAYLAEAKYEQTYSETFFRQNEFVAALECAENRMILAVKSLFFVAGEIYSSNPDHINNALSQGMKHHRSLLFRFQQLSQKVEEIKPIFTKDSVQDILGAINDWFNEISQRIEWIQLGDFDIKKGVHRIDLVADASPVQLLKIKQALKYSDRVEVKLKSDVGENLIVNGLLNSGYELLGKSEKEDPAYTILTIANASDEVVDDSLIEDVQTA